MDKNLCISYRIFSDRSSAFTKYSITAWGEINISKKTVFNYLFSLIEYMFLLGFILNVTDLTISTKLLSLFLSFSVLL